MRFSAAALLFCLSATVALVSSEDADYDYGEDVAAALDEKVETRPQPAAPRRPVLPTAPRKSPLSRSRPAASSPPPPPPPQEEDPEPEELEQGEDEDGAPVTEASTKKPLIRGGVRPFRSNQDLLEALKRRRQNIRVSTHSPEDSGDAPSTPAPTSSSRRRYNSGRSAAKATAPEEVEESPKAPARSSNSRSGRRFSSRGRGAEEEEEPVVEEPKSRTGRRRF